MTKLSLNKAAKEAGVAKSTILEALNSKRMSAEKNDKGHWEIDPAELFRVYPKTSPTEQVEPIPTLVEKHGETSALEVEVKMLREQMDDVRSMNERERQTLVGQIDDLKAEAERRSREHMQALAVLTDQREKAKDPLKRGFWARLMG